MISDTCEVLPWETIDSYWVSDIPTRHSLIGDPIIECDGTLEVRLWDLRVDPVKLISSMQPASYSQAKTMTSSGFPTTPTSFRAMHASGFLEYQNRKNGSFLSTSSGGKFYHHKGRISVLIRRSDGTVINKYDYPSCLSADVPVRIRCDVPMRDCLVESFLVQIEGASNYPHFHNPVVLGECWVEVPPKSDRKGGELLEYVCDKDLVVPGLEDVLYGVISVGTRWVKSFSVEKALGQRVEPANRANSNSELGLPEKPLPYILSWHNRKSPTSLVESGGSSTSVSASNVSESSLETLLAKYYSKRWTGTGAGMYLTEESPVFEWVVTHLWAQFQGTCKKLWTNFWYPKDLSPCDPRMAFIEIGRIVVERDDDFNASSGRFRRKFYVELICYGGDGSVLSSAMTGKVEVGSFSHNRDIRTISISQVLELVVGDHPENCTISTALYEEVEDDGRLNAINKRKSVNRFSGSFHLPKPSLTNGVVSRLVGESETRLVDFLSLVKNEDGRKPDHRVFVELSVGVAVEIRAKLHGWEKQSPKQLMRPISAMIQERVKEEDKEYTAILQICRWQEQFAKKHWKKHLAAHSAQFLLGIALIQQGENCGSPEINICKSLQIGDHQLLPILPLLRDSLVVTFSGENSPSTPTLSTMFRWVSMIPSVEELLTDYSGQLPTMPYLSVKDTLQYFRASELGKCVLLIKLLNGGASKLTSPIIGISREGKFCTLVLENETSMLWIMFPGSMPSESRIMHVELEDCGVGDNGSSIGVKASNISRSPVFLSLLITPDNAYINEDMACDEFYLQVITGAKRMNRLFDGSGRGDDNCFRKFDQRPQEVVQCVTGDPRLSITENRVLFELETRFKAAHPECAVLTNISQMTELLSSIECAKLSGEQIIDYNEWALLLNAAHSPPFSLGYAKSPLQVYHFEMSFSGLDAIDVDKLGSKGTVKLNFKIEEAQLGVKVFEYFAATVVAVLIVYR